MSEVIATTATTNLGRVSIVPKGDYDATVQYSRLDVVKYNRDSYLAKTSVQGVTPGTDATKWMLLVEGAMSVPEAEAIVEDLEDDVSQLQSAITNHLVSDEIKTALLACIQELAWAADNGQTLYDSLSFALNPPANLASISAVYTQSGTVYTTDDLSVLRSGLVVTAHYSDATEAVVHAYIISGTLTAGTSTVTVTYGGKTATFTVEVTDATMIYELAAPVTFTGSSSEMIDTGVVVMPAKRDLTMLIEFTPDANIPNGRFVFWSGDAASPYYTMTIKAYSQATQPNYSPYMVETNGTAHGFRLTNLVNGEKNRVALRYTNGAAGVQVDAYNATNGSLSGATTQEAIVSQAHLKLGDFTSSGGAPYVGVISDFRVYTRVLTDEEIYAWLDTGV